MKRHGFAHNSGIVKTFHKMMRRHVKLIKHELMQDLRPCIVSACAVLTNTMAKRAISSLPKKQRRPFSEMFRGCNEQALQRVPLPPIRLSST